PDPDRLGVLTTHVDHRACAWKHVHRAASMATDLGHLGVSEGDAIPAVSGTNHIFDFFLLYVCVAKGLGECLFGSENYVCAGVDQCPPDDLPGFIDHDGFRLRGSNINSGGVSHWSFPPCPEILRLLGRLLLAVCGMPGLRRKRRCGSSFALRRPPGDPSCRTR